MKVTLEFDSIEERDELEDAMNGGRWHGVVLALYESYLRPLWKHGDDEKLAEFAEGVWEWLAQRLSDENLSLW